MRLLNFFCSIVFGVGVTGILHFTFPGDTYFNGYVTGASYMLYYFVFLREIEDRKKLHKVT